MKRMSTAKIAERRRTSGRMTNVAYGFAQGLTQMFVSTNVGGRTRRYPRTDVSAGEKLTADWARVSGDLTSAVRRVASQGR